MARQDADEFSSCEAQRLACLQFLASRLPELWLPVGGVFDDVGVSGASLDRPGMLALLERIEKGDIDRVLVHRFDRLTRNFRDWLTLVRIFEKHRVTLSVASGDLHAGELASNDMMLNTLANFAELEREMIRDRLADARAARRRRGLRSAGRLPYGYRSDPRTRQLVPEQAEVDIVGEIFKRAANGERPAAIAAWANAREAKGSGSWSARKILRMLKNPVYVGDLGRDDERIQGAHPAIVTQEVFDAVQEAIAQRQTRAPAPRPEATSREDPFLLRGLVTCATCGHPMTTSASRALPAPTTRRRQRTQEVPRYYRCRSGSGPCPGSQVAALDLEEAVVSWLSEPPQDQMPAEVAGKLSHLMSTWSLLWQVNRQRLLRALIEELRWDGSSSTFTLVLNEDWLAEPRGHREEKESMT